MTVLTPSLPDPFTIFIFNSLLPPTQNDSTSSSLYKNPHRRPSLPASLRRPLAGDPSITPLQNPIATHCSTNQPPKSSPHRSRATPPPSLHRHPPPAFPGSASLLRQSPPLPPPYSSSSRQAPTLNRPPPPLPATSSPAAHFHCHTSHRRITPPSSYRATAHNPPAPPPTASSTPAAHHSAHRAIHLLPPLAPPPITVLPQPPALAPIDATTAPPKRRQPAAPLPASSPTGHRLRSTSAAIGLHPPSRPSTTALFFPGNQRTTAGPSLVQPAAAPSTAS